VRGRAAVRRLPADWAWAQTSVAADAGAGEVEERVAGLRSLLPPGGAVLWVDAVPAGRGLPEMLMLTLAVPGGRAGRVLLSAVRGVAGGAGGHGGGLLRIGGGRPDPAEGGGVPGGFRCPRCGAVSANPVDAVEGYCGRCRDWTAAARGEDV
jgi:hypothetical protein